jgi:hypothetical protein
MMTSSIVTGHLEGSFHPQGTVYQVRGNQPILLDDPRTVWVVQSGSVVIFPLPVNASAVGGGRRYLFTAESGNALFGNAPQAESAYQLLAVAMGEAKVLKIEQNGINQLFVDRKDQISVWVNDWVKQLATLLPPVEMPQGNPDYTTSERQIPGQWAGLYPACGRDYLVNDSAGNRPLAGPRETGDQPSLWPLSPL